MNSLAELATSSTNNDQPMGSSSLMSATNVGTPPRQTGLPFVAPPLRVAFSWTLAGNVIYAACQFGILSALAKLGNPSVVGQYALALAVAAPVFMLTNLQLRGVQSTDARHEYDFSDYFTLRVISSTLGLAAVTLIVAFASYDSTTKKVIMLVAGAKAIETIGDVIAGHLQKFERLDQVATALVIRGTASVATFTAVYWFTRNPVTATAALAMTWLLTIALYDFRVASGLLVRRRVTFHFCFDTMKRLVSISLPLGIVMTLLSLNTNLPRYILERKLGEAELGIFASLAYLLTAMNVTVVALGQSASARMARQFAGYDMRGFRALLARMITFAALFGMVGMGLALIIGRPLLTFVYRPEYAEHVDLFLVMVATTSVNAIATFLGMGMTSARCFRMQIPVMLVTITTTLVLTLTLVPYLGLIGAGYALLISAGVQVSASYLVLNSVIHRKQAQA